MRKDVKLGLAVGGLLVAVVLVYGIFFAGGRGHNQRQQTELPVTDVQPETPAVASSGTPSSTDTSNTTSSSGTPTLGTTVTPPTTSGNTSTENSIAHDDTASHPIDPPVTSGNTGDPRANSIPPANPPVADAGKWDWNQALEKGAGAAVIHTEVPADIKNESVPFGIPNPPSTDSSAPRAYTVKSGESLWTIAKREYGNGAYVSHLLRANPKIDANRLRAGTVITLPPRGEVVPSGISSAPGTPAAAPQAIDQERQYVVQAGDSLNTICKRLYGNISLVKKMYDLNKDVIGPNASALKRGMVLTLPEPRPKVAGAN